MLKSQEQSYPQRRHVVECQWREHVAAEDPQLVVPLGREQLDHSQGVTGPLEEVVQARIEQSGADAVAVDSTVPPVWIRDELQSKVAVQGNLDPILLVSGGKALRDSATEIMDALAGGPFVFNLGSGIVPQASPDHVAELIDLVRSWPAQ